MVIMDIILLLISRVVVVERMGVVRAGTYHLVCAGLLVERALLARDAREGVKVCRRERSLALKRDGNFGGEARRRARTFMAARLRPLTRSGEVNTELEGSRTLLAAACIMTSNHSGD